MSYTNKIELKATSAKTFDAIQNLSAWWTKHISYQSESVFIVNFEKGTFWKLKQTETIPFEKIVWVVTEAHHEVHSLSRKNEWQDTSIHWFIKQDGKKCTVDFLHTGLTQALECYDICSNGWSHFLNSLKKFIEEGKGYPFS